MCDPFSHEMACNGEPIASKIVVMNRQPVAWKRLGFAACALALALAAAHPVLHAADGGGAHDCAVCQSPVAAPNSPATAAKPPLQAEDVRPAAVPPHTPSFTARSSPSRAPPASF